MGKMPNNMLTDFTHNGVVRSGVFLSGPTVKNDLNKGEYLQQMFMLHMYKADGDIIRVDDIIEVNTVMYHVTFRNESMGHLEFQLSRAGV